MNVNDLKHTVTCLKNLLFINAKVLNEKNKV